MSGSGNNNDSQTNQGGDNSYYQSQDQYYQSGQSQSQSQDQYYQSGQSQSQAQSSSGPYFQPPLTSENIAKHDQIQGERSSVDYYMQQDQRFERIAQGIPSKELEASKGSKGSKAKDSKSKGSKRR